MASTYTWSLVSGSLPPGLTLDTGATGRTTTLTGTPSSTGTYNFTVRITNDISGAFDDQAYTVEIVAIYLEVTPDIGLPVSDMFNPAVNPKLERWLSTDLTDLGPSADYSDKYNPVRDLRFYFDAGSGNRVYQVPAPLVEGLNSIGRRYLWRASDAPNDVKEIYIV